MSDVVLSLNSILFVCSSDRNSFCFVNPLLEESIDEDFSEETIVVKVFDVALLVSRVSALLVEISGTLFKKDNVELSTVLVTTFAFRRDTGVLAETARIPTLSTEVVVVTLISVCASEIEIVALSSEVVSSEDSRLRLDVFVLRVVSVVFAFSADVSVDTDELDSSVESTVIVFSDDNREI
jgi:hypothetical protein